MVKGRIRHMFAGGNTSQGFFSYFSNILKQDEALKIFLLKGGPGTGKSTFMKKIGNEMLDRGFDIEHMHCSSDPDSLDGIVIPAIKIALIDGTAPHVVDPKTPGAVDEIINLGEFWNDEGLRTNKDDIQKITGEISRNFARAYRYIKAAEQIYEDMAAIYGSAVDNAKINITAAEIINELFGDKPVSSVEGKQRHLFASAITPRGLKHFLPSLLTTKNIIVLTGSPGTGTDRLLEKVRSSAVDKGFYVESYYCALQPEKLEHLVIPEADVAFTTFNDYHNADIKYGRKIDFDEFLNKEAVKYYEDELKYDCEEFDGLLDRAIKTISKSKALHDELETYYITNIDFEEVQRCFERTLGRILDYSRELD